MNEFPKGECACGALYACDATGHNVGAAMVEALVSACGDDWDFAWELMPEDDYLTGRIEHYDEETHQVIEAGSLNGRAVRGVLYFVRLHTELAEIAGRARDKNKEASAAASADVPPSVPPPRPSGPRQRATKERGRQLAGSGDVDGLAALCLDDKKTLRLLQRFLYDPDENARWRLAWLIGEVCAKVASRDPGQVAELLHRLFEACSDSAATPWGMIETMGAVIALRPDIFGAFARHLLNFAGQPATRQQTLWALAEIAASRRDLIRAMPFYALLPMLQHEDAAVRGLTARLLGRIKAKEAVMQILPLTGDASPFPCWEKGQRQMTSVRDEAQKALAGMQGG
jgi:HEAT repeat protein